MSGKQLADPDKNKLKEVWQEVKLSDVATLNYGKSLQENKRVKGSVPVYSSGGLIDWHNEALVDSRGLIIGRKGTIGSVHKSEVPFYAIDTAFYITEDDTKCNLDYLFYNLSILGLENLNSDSAVPGLNIHTAHSQKILLPPLPEQEAIAEVLSSLDDKIDILHRQNKTLENLAQTLFHQWFIKEADLNRHVKPLSYFGKIICGKTPSKKVHEWYGGKIPFIKIPDMHNQTFVLNAADTLTEEGRDSQQNKILPPKSICVSCIATVGLVSMNASEAQTNQQINSIIPKKDEYRYFIYLFMKSSKNLLVAMSDGGTATKNLNTRDFSKITAPFDKKLISDFHCIVKPIFNKIYYNQCQIMALETIRDTLLPKLMNGQNTAQQIFTLSKDPAPQIIDEIIFKLGSGNYIFRGTTQEFSKNETNQINSSLYRLIKKGGLDFSRTHVEIEQQIIDRAKKYFSDKTSNIEVLTDLQHYGGATNLIDFSTNIYVALFFACSGDFEKHGELICIDTTSDNNNIVQKKEISYNKKGSTTKTYIEDEISTIDPAAIQNSQRRVLSQSSIFIYPKYGYINKEGLEIYPIYADSKKMILNHLKKFVGIDENTIFNDFIGFIVNQKNTPEGMINFYQGEAEMEVGDFKEAIQSYTKAIKLNPNYAEAYLGRGKAKHKLEKYNSGIEDFNRAIELNPNYAEAYLGRGKAKHKLEKYNSGIEDFNRAIELNPIYETTLRPIIKGMEEKIQKAETDKS